MSRKVSKYLAVLAIILFLIGKFHGAIIHSHPRAIVTSASETAFIVAVLADLGAPKTPADISSMASWYLHEWSSWPPGAANNPWDSTLNAPGATDFNTFGNGYHVRNYPSATEGAAETAQTLLSGYPGIVAALRSGRGVCGGSFSGEFLAWSGNAYSSVC